MHQQGNQLDYLGIVILMWGSTIPSVYYGLYCDPKLQKLYWLVVSSRRFPPLGERKLSYHQRSRPSHLLAFTQLSTQGSAIHISDIGEQQCTLA